MTTSTLSKSSLPPTETLTSESQVPIFVAGVALSFQTPTPNTFTTAFVTEIDSTPPPYPHPSVTPHRFETHFSDGMLNGFNSGASLVASPSVSHPSALALWEPPHFKGVPFDQTSTISGPVRSEWKALVARMRSQYLGDYHDNHYHLAFLARNPDPNVGRVNGAISAVMLPFLKRAREEKVPAWLDATSPEAARIYEHFGWRVCEEVNFGIGRVDARGWPLEGGEGIRGWGMIYDGHLKQSD